MTTHLIFGASFLSLIVSGTSLANPSQIQGERGVNVCMNALGGVKQGAPLGLWGCAEDNGPNSSFSFDGKHLSVGGLCLAAPGGRYVIAAACGAGSLVIKPEGKLLKTPDGKCLDAEEGKTGWGTKLVIWPCHGDTNQQWKFPQAWSAPSFPPRANIVVAGGISNDRKFLSVPANGAKADLWNVDDQSGRQRWRIQPSADGESFNILVDDGVSGRHRYLSVNRDGTKVDLWHADDKSGRQRWVFESVGDAFNIRVAGGVKGKRTLLSVTADGTKVDLWHVDDNSGRQKWRVTPAAEGAQVIAEPTPPAATPAPPPAAERDCGTGKDDPGCNTPRNGNLPMLADLYLGIFENLKATRNELVRKDMIVQTLEKQYVTARQFTAILDLFNNELVKMDVARAGAPKLVDPVRAIAYGPKIRNSLTRQEFLTLINEQQ